MLGAHRPELYPASPAGPLAVRAFPLPVGLLLAPVRPGGQALGNAFSKENAEFIFLL